MAHDGVAGGGGLGDARDGDAGGEEPLAGDARPEHTVGFAGVCGAQRGRPRPGRELQEEVAHPEDVGPTEDLVIGRQRTVGGHSLPTEIH